MTGTDLTHAAQLLREGQLVAIPTETVYGLAGNALDPYAVARIFEVKNRPRFNPLILHLAHAGQLDDYTDQVPAAARRLADTCWPGPLTLLLPRRPTVPDLVTAGTPRVAVRVPDHPLAQALLAQLDFPLAAPSANPFGYISPTTAAHVVAQLGASVPYVVDGGPSAVGLESTIVGWEGNQAVVYRLGGLPVEQLRKVLGRRVVVCNASSTPQAPGMTTRHYAPRVPVLVGDLPTLLAQHDLSAVAVLSLRATFPALPTGRQVQLSPNGDLQQAATRLFAALRYLDGLPTSVILAEWMPDKGLGRALNDRLRRAAATAEPPR